MRRSAFLFFKGLGLLFAILCGIGTAVLGWYHGADWMNIVTFSIAVTGLILWGWYHFSVRWIDSDLKQNILSQFPKKEYKNNGLHFGSSSADSKLSLVLHLNDNYEGGNFHVNDKEYITKKGSVMVFPSAFMYPHGVKEVTKGERWSISIFMK